MKAAHFFRLFTVSISAVLLLAACQLVSLPVKTPEASPTATLSPVTVAQTQHSQELTATPMSTAGPCEVHQGQIVDEQIPTDLLTLPLNVKIYLPPCYSSSGQPEYPVLYMLHGQASKNDQWQRLGLLSAADELISAGIITPMIIVMPYELSWNASPDESKFGESVLQDLIPFVDANYHTRKVRAGRAIGGLSRGGNWAVNLGFTHPELYISIGAHSAPLFYGEIWRITPLVKTQTTKAQLPAIYVDVGNKDENLSQVMTFVDLLKKNNVPYSFTEFKGFHSEEYWSAHVQDYLVWYSSQFTDLN